jgi:hypothetical protein
MLALVLPKFGCSNGPEPTVAAEAVPAAERAVAAEAAPAAEPAREPTPREPAASTRLDQPLPAAELAAAPAVVDPQSTEAAALARGVAYLTSIPLESAGIDFVESTYTFRLKYPKAPDLGNHFVLASVARAYVAAERAADAQRIVEYLRPRQRPDGLFPFDAHGISIDSDTTLNAIDAIHAAGALEPEVARRAFATLDGPFRDGCRYRTYPRPDMTHPDGAAHPEVTYNVLYLRSVAPRMPGPRPACIAKAVAADQRSDGYFPSYWYPDRLHVHHDALRALRAYQRATGARLPEIERAVRRGFEYLFATQSEDGGWGTPSNAFDTAAAVSALRMHGHEASPEATRLAEALARGRAWLVRAQLPDGSWPGVRIFYWYYPECEAQKCAEEWHDRTRRLLSTAAAVRALGRRG